MSLPQQPRAGYIIGMKAQMLRFPAAALSLLCFISAAAARNSALQDLFDASGQDGSPAPQARTVPDVSAPFDTNTGGEFAYVDQRHLVPEEALRTALKFYKESRTRFGTHEYLSVIDYTQPASAKRFYVINMRTGAVERFLVAHGSGSDPGRTGYARYFSNENRTHATSLGFYRTGETYYGENGYSLRLEGLSSTNSNARAREIVVHGADYVNALGRSWGCPAVEMSQRTRVINMIKGGSLIYAYYRGFNADMDNASGESSYAKVSGPASEDGAAEEPVSVSVDKLPDEVAYLVRKPAEEDPQAKYFDPSKAADNGGDLPASIPYLDIVLKVCKEKGVDPALVLAVIQQESRFNPKARSSEGALGLMQVMPATARGMGLKDAQKLLIPEVNIRYGVQFIKDLWNEFGSKDLSRLSAGDINRTDVLNTIAAYNAGPGNVKKYHGIPPFRETRDYTAKVSANFGKFKNLSEI